MAKSWPSSKIFCHRVFIIADASKGQPTISGHLNEIRTLEHIITLYLSTLIPIDQMDAVLPQERHSLIMAHTLANCAVIHLHRPVALNDPSSYAKCSQVSRVCVSIIRHIGERDFPFLEPIIAVSTTSLPKSHIKSVLALLVVSSRDYYSWSRCTRSLMASCPTSWSANGLASYISCYEGAQHTISGRWYVLDLICWLCWCSPRPCPGQSSKTLGTVAWDWCFDLFYAYTSIDHFHAFVTRWMRNRTFVYKSCANLGLMTLWLFGCYDQHGSSKGYPFSPSSRTAVDQPGLCTRRTCHFWFSRKHNRIVRSTFSVVSLTGAACSPSNEWPAVNPTGYWTSTEPTMVGLWPINGERRSVATYTKRDLQPNSARIGYW